MNAKAEIKTEDVEYKVGSTVMDGYIAYDDARKGPLPAVIIVPDWMGLRENPKKRARDIAELGYIGFAIDVYGKGNLPKNSDEAAALATKYKNDRKLLRSHVKAAYDFISKYKMTDKKKIATMGYCFGGTTALELARSGAKLVGTVTFHGGLSNPAPADAKNIHGRVLVLHGAIDPYVKADEVAAFQKEMNDAKIDYEFIAYSGAVHSFTIPDAGNDISKGAAYNPVADKRSFNEMKRFFSEIF